MNVVIVEDEAPAARRLRKLLETLDPVIQVQAVLDSVEAAAHWFAREAPPDLVFMDIHLADGLSFEIFRRVDLNAPVVFTTAYDEYALQAFKVNSIDYLLKPIDNTELAAAIAKWRGLQARPQAPEDSVLARLLESAGGGEGRYKSRFLVKQGQKLIPISVEDVAYFLTEEKVVFLVDTTNRRYVVNYSLDELENMLDPAAFQRVNRQFVLSFGCIREISTFFNGKLKVRVLPDVPEGVIVSRERANVFKQWLDR